jgi:hypothetical protein
MVLRSGIRASRRTPGDSRMQEASRPLAQSHMRPCRRLDPQSDGGRIWLSRNDSQTALNYADGFPVALLPHSAWLRQRRDNLRGFATAEIALLQLSSAGVCWFVAVAVAGDEWGVQVLDEGGEEVPLVFVVTD